MLSLKQQSVNQERSRKGFRVDSSRIGKAVNKEIDSG